MAGGGADTKVGQIAVLNLLADRLADLPDGGAILDLVRLAVEESEARYRSLFENLEAGFCVVKLAFDGEGKAIDYRFLEVNRAFEGQTGLKGAVGQWMRQLAPEHEQHWFDIYGQVALSGDPLRFEQAANALDGRWYDVHAFRIGDPEAHQVAILFTDITERRRTELALHASQEALRRLNASLEQQVTERSDALFHAQEALRQSQKLEAMGQLTGGVAHDFNNLLTPIIGGLDVLRRREMGGPREQRLIEAALQSADRAKTLVQRLLAFARRQPLQPAPVDVTTLIHGMTDLISSTLGPQVRLSVHAMDLPPALSDANQLEMALLNLAVNARDAMPEGGALSISAAVESVVGEHRAGLATGDYVRLSISDTGAGMPEEVRTRAIEPFFSTKGVGKGTGLGLSMVHGLTVQLGGGLSIESAPDAGTVVELWLPVAASAADMLEPAAPTLVVGRATGRVLLVDDDALVRMSTADMLGELGYQVVEATSAEEALLMMRDGLSADLLVTDHLMPGMTGVDLVRALRTLRPALPALVISGYSEAEGIAADLPRLTKPFRLPDLAAGLAGLTPVV